MTAYQEAGERSNSVASQATVSSLDSSQSTDGQQRAAVGDQLYYDRLLNLTRRASISEDYPEDPPPYDLAGSGTSSPSHGKVKVEPRLDEGREALPAYSCSITQHAVFLRKMEFESAVHQAHDRSWHKVWVELRGTALTFYATKSAGMFSSSKSAANPTPDLPPDVKRGTEIQTYSLQHADVGIAADYLKRRYVIRARVEAEQFLLCCIELETFLLWMESLSAAIDLAPPLDDRRLPVDTSIPRSIRRRRRPAVQASEGVNHLARQQSSSAANEVAFRSSNSPALAAPESPASAARRRSSCNSSNPQCHPDIPAISSTPSDCSSHHTASISPATAPPSNPPAHRPSSKPVRNHRRTASTAIPTPTPSHALPSFCHSNAGPPGTASEKWAPTHQWSPFYDMMYAKRCMAVLLRQSPRKTNFVVLGGKLWVVDWATGALQRCEPPGYDELHRAGPAVAGSGAGAGAVRV